jgi:flagellar basal body-associated protein FliL
MSKSKLGIIVLVLLLSLSVSLVAAQYATSKTTDITLGSDGKFNASEQDVGVSYEIQGTPGASGTVNAAVYDGNPQASAGVPSGVSLAHFVVVTFDMNASDFTSAKITISYNDSDVQNLKAPFALYKYVSTSNSYVELPSTVDTAAKTISVTLVSVDDPLFAVGGAAVTSGGLSLSSWAIVIVVSIAVMLVAVFVVSRLRHSDNVIVSEFSTRQRDASSSLVKRIFQLFLFY